MLKFLAIPAIGLASILGGCNPPVHNTCVEDPDGWTRCRNDSTGKATVAFPTTLACPTEDSCSLAYEKDAGHEGWVIRPDVP